jgi:hypothetical protein
MNCSDNIKAMGSIDGIIEYNNGKTLKISCPNTVLILGRNALVNTLINNTGEYPNLFINRMVFGDGGVDGTGTPKLVTTNRTGLFGTVRATKPVVSTANPDNSTQAIFTSVLTYDDGNGYSLSEMALVLNNSDYYSMVTFPPITKSSSMQITWNWSLSFI